MEALDKILDSKMTSTTKDHIIDELESYREYLELIKELDQKSRMQYLNMIKRKELIANQEMEHEDSFMCEMGLNMELSKKNTVSIDIARKSILDGKILTLNDFINVHRVLLKGTSDDKQENYGIRNREVTVGYFQNKEEHIQFIPPHPSELKEYLNKLLYYINNLPENEKVETTVFYKPIIEHFYITALQPFGNGNTRLSRLVEYSEIFNLTRKILGEQISSPVLYLTQNYFATGSQYREKIADLVNDPTTAQLEKWFTYNLNLIEEQLYYSKNNLTRWIKQRR